MTLSALLLFVLQPLLAGLLLPKYGGVAGVWAVAMFFFPCVLLLGYAYAPVAARNPRFAAAVVAASLLLLPLRVPSTVSHQQPVLSLLLTLSLTAGVPFFLLSATSPTLQSWHGSFRLYALSNAASMGGLLAYPFLIETMLGRALQLQLWSLGYAVYVVLFAISAWRAVPAPIPESCESANWPLWITLSAIPAALWLAVANQISQSVAPVPLLWILPLATYLLTLILCFDGGWYRPATYRWLLLPALAALLLAYRQHAWNRSLLLGVALFLSGLFVCAMICHGELAARRPHASQPFRFYLAVALGGVIGSGFVSLAAPKLFTDHLEFPIALLACAIAGIALLWAPLRRTALAGLVVLSVVVLAGVQYLQGGGLRMRNFYGTLEVMDKPEYRLLANGTILHGFQLRDPARMHLPTGYYVPESGVGQALSAFKGRPRRVGIVGLGVGTLAAYARDDDTFRFYEINPAVVDVAQRHFLYLRQAKGRTEVVMGDARLALEAEAPQQYDVLVLDAFSGDAIPTHLLTREAFDVYRRHLATNGVLAVHVTGKYVNLAPVVQATASAAGLASRVVIHAADPQRQVLSAMWVLAERRGQMAAMSRPPWTDDHVSLWSVFRR